MAPKLVRGGLIGVGDAILVFSTGDFTDVSAAASSASGSYPSFSIRSASSFAFFSAASKLIASPPPIFFAPNFCVFLAPSTFAFRGPLVVAVFRIEEDVIVRDGAGAVVSLSMAASGVFGLADPLPFAPAFRNGEAVRLITGGVCVREGGLLGLLMAGLSHDEKKSSLGSPEGVDEPSLKVGERMSVITTSSGNLPRGQYSRSQGRVGILTPEHRRPPFS